MTHSVGDVFEKDSRVITFKYRTHRVEISHRFNIFASVDKPGEHMWFSETF